MEDFVRILQEGTLSKPSRGRRSDKGLATDADGDPGALLMMPGGDGDTAVVTSGRTLQNHTVDIVQSLVTALSSNFGGMITPVLDRMVESNQLMAAAAQSFTQTTQTLVAQNQE